MFKLSDFSGSISVEIIVSFFPESRVEMEGTILIRKGVERRIEMDLEFSLKVQFKNF